MSRKFPVVYKSIFSFALLLILSFGNRAFAQAPTSLQYPTVNVFRTNLDNVFLSPTVSGNITSYTINPSVPAGLSFDVNTGIISGIPTTATSATNYLITAINGAGSATATISIQTVNYYYNNANGQVSFLAANAVPKVYSGTLATAGQSQGDIMLYTNVVTIAGQSIDCIITSRIVNNVTSWNAYDQPAASGSNFNSNSDNFFSPQVTYGTGGGSMTFDFQFILGGSYDNLTNKGTNVILQNVKLNTYDIDGNGTAIQYNEFGGFSTSELGTTTNEVVSFNAAAGLTKYTSNTATNTIAITDPTNRVRVSYNEMSSFSIGVGADNTGLAFFFLDFSVGGAFTTNSTPAPSIDLNTVLIGVNNGSSGCGSTLNFIGGTGQTNSAAITDLVEFDLHFPTSDIVNGASEKLVINGASAGNSIALNFANAAIIPDVVFGTTITYGVTATVSGGVSTLSFVKTGGSSLFTLARAEELIDALEYQNIAVAPTNGSRTFTVNIRNTNFKSPDAIYTATLNCVSISGNIYHDANALTDNLVNPNSTSGQFANASMYAIMVDPVSNLVTKTQTISGSAYNFGTASPGKYLLYFSNNTPPSVGASYNASTFPTGGYVSIGENLGASAGNDQLVDGKLILTVGSVSVVNANFGLQIPPTASGVNQASSLNPGGYNYKTVTPANFGASDADGTVNSITITSFPTNANVLKIGSTVYISGGTCPPQSSCVTWPGSVTIPNSGGVPSSSISVDPIDGASTVVINYRSTDNGNATSSTSSISVPFTVAGSPVNISGNVWNDANGDGNLNGAETLTNAANSGETLYAFLTQTTNTYSGLPTIYTSTPVSATTGYSFTNVPSGNDYIIQIVSTSSPLADGSAASNLIPALATGYTGVSTNNSGVLSQNLNTNNLINSLPALSTSKTNVNFGIDRAPSANNATYTISQPAANSTKSLTVPNSMGNLAGTDPEDGTIGSGANIRITSVAGLNSNILKYNGTTLAANSTISAYNPTLLTLTFANTGSLSAVFNFVFVDNAGVPGTSPATYTVNWTAVLAVSLISFDASADNKTVKLNWQTANELSIAGYDVQRSDNSINWKNILSQSPHGSGNYTANDLLPNDGINYYRLQIRSQNGSVTYSDVRKVIFNADKIGINIWPNPVTSKVTVTNQNNTQMSTIKIFNANGETVFKTIPNATSAVIDMHNLAAGVYSIIVNYKDGTLSNSKIIKK